MSGTTLPRTDNYNRRSKEGYKKWNLEDDLTVNRSSICDQHI